MARRSRQKCVYVCVCMHVWNGIRVRFAGGTRWSILFGEVDENWEEKKDVHV